jgi:hypothetical protein
MAIQQTPNAKRQTPNAKQAEAYYHKCTSQSNNAPPANAQMNALKNNKT